jgi:hypothetical protein
MYLFYVDESGSPSGWNDQENFVLGAVAVHEGQVRRLSEELGKVQRQFFPLIQVPIEFHASHIRGGKACFRSIGKDQQAALLDALYNIIANAGFPSLIAFITAIHVTAVQTPNQALHDCLEDICERFNTFLVREHKAGYTNKGIMIVDRSGRETAIRRLMADFERHGTSRGYLGNIIDVPYFADSSHTRMLQLADFVTFAGGRYFNYNDITYLEKILCRIDSLGPDGRMVGLKHITGTGHDCSCIALH